MATCKTPFLPPYMRALKEVLSRSDYVPMEGVKSAGRETFSPEHGGSYDAWAARPLSQPLISYLTSDLCSLFKIRDRFIRGGAAPRGFGQAEVARASAERAAKTFEKGELPWAHGKEWHLLDFDCLSSSMSPRLPQLTSPQSDDALMPKGRCNFSFDNLPGGSAIDSPSRFFVPSLADEASGRDRRSFGSGSYDNYAAAGCSSGGLARPVAPCLDPRVGFPPISIGGSGWGARPAVTPREIRFGRRSSSCVGTAQRDSCIKSAAF